MEAYYFQRLSRAQQSAYHSMLAGLTTLSTSFSVPRMDGKELGMLLELLRLDHPEIFYVTGFRYRYDPQGTKVEFLPTYLFEKSKIQTHRQALQARVEKLVRPAREWKPQEQEKYIHDFLCEHVVYDKLKKPYSHEILGPLTQGVGVCEGIAKSAKVLCDALGIWCIVALSEAAPDKGICYRHAWNVVKLGSAYYHMDATFDNTLSEGDIIRYDYLNLDDGWLFRDHQKLIYEVPHCTDAGAAYYRTKKLSFTKYDEIANRAKQAIRKNMPLIFHWRGNYLSREVLAQLVEFLTQVATERGKYPHIRLNWAQAVFEVRFTAQIPPQVLTQQQVNEEIESCE